MKLTENAYLKMECSRSWTLTWTWRNERKTTLTGRNPVAVLLWSEKQEGRRIQQIILISFRNAVERYLNNPPLKSEEKSEQTTALSVLNSRPSSSQLRNAAMFCHRLYKMVANQSAQESPQPFQPVRQIHSGEMSATVVEADSRSTTFTITCNEMLGGMFSNYNIHSLSLQINMNMPPSTKKWSGSNFSNFFCYLTWELFK